MADFKKLAADQAAKRAKAKINEVPTNEAPAPEVPTSEAPAAPEAPAGAMIKVPPGAILDLIRDDGANVIAAFDQDSVVSIIQNGGIDIPGIDNLSAVGGFLRLQCVDPVPKAGSCIGIRFPALGENGAPSQEEAVNAPPGWELVNCSTNGVEYRAALLPFDAEVWIMATRRGWRSEVGPGGVALDRPRILPWGKWIEGTKATCQLALLIAWGLGDQGVVTGRFVLSLSGAGASRGMDQALTVAATPIHLPTGGKVRNVHPMTLSASRSIPNPHGGVSSWLMKAVPSIAPFSWSLRAGSLIHDWLASGGHKWAQHWAQEQEAVGTSDEAIPF